MKKSILAVSCFLAMSSVMAQVDTQVAAEAVVQAKKYTESKEFLLAYTIMKKNPEYFSNAQKAQISGDYAVLLLRAAGVDTNEESKDLLVQAEQVQAAVLSTYLAQAQDKEKLRYVSDYLVILSQKSDYSKAIKVYEDYSLKQDLPVYALMSVFKAYAKTKQYQSAFNVLTEAKAKDPQSFELQKEKIMLLCDMQLYTQAQKIAYAFERSYKAGTAEKKQAQHLLVLTHLYANNFTEAQGLLSEYLKEYPKDIDFHIAQADLYAWSGQDLKALDEYNWLISVHPDSQYAKEKKALLQSAKGKAVEGIVAGTDLATKIADNQKAVISVGARQDKQSAPTYTNYENKTEVWGRFYALDGVVGYSLLGNDASSVNKTFVTATADYTYHADDNLSGTLGIAANRFGKMGVYAGADYAIADEIRLGFKAEKNSADAPMKATMVGTTVDKVTTKVSGVIGAGTSYSLQASKSSFSDGNDRLDASVSIRTPVLTYDRHNFLFGAAAYYTKNDAPAGFKGAYFNPGKMGSYELTGAYFTQWGQLFGNALGHRFDVSLGNAKQQNFDAITTYSLNYSLTIKQSSDLEYTLRAGLGSRPYDGVSEKTISLSGNVLYKF